MDRRALHTDDPAKAKQEKNARAKAACNKRGGVAVGMSKQQVLASCWGSPRKKNLTVTASGTREQWVYGGGYAPNRVFRALGSVKFLDIRQKQGVFLFPQSGI